MADAGDIVVDFFVCFFVCFSEYATGYYADQEKKSLGIQPDLTQNAVVIGVGGGGGGGASTSTMTTTTTPAYCEYTYSEPTSASAKSGALTPVRLLFLFFVCISA